MQVNWNLVSAILPAALVDVLAVVFDPEIDPEPQVIMAYVDRAGRWCMTPTGDSLADSFVTHWAPLPAVPEAH